MKLLIFLLFFCSFLYGQVEYSIVFNDISGITIQSYTTELWYDSLGEFQADPIIIPIDLSISKKNNSFIFSVKENKDYYIRIQVKDKVIPIYIMGGPKISKPINFNIDPFRDQLLFVEWSNKQKSYICSHY
jgi:hypothetical protein